MSTTSTGREAESLVASALTNEGHKIVAMNWRTRWCEIDIISTKQRIVYFTEVKYRKSATWGGGLDYISSKKLEQMQFAAEMWIAVNRWSGEVQLKAAEVDVQGRITFVDL
jgi:uncharacterized protein (TIGR00252 family)